MSLRLAILGCLGRSLGLPDTGFSCENEEDGAMLERMFEQVEGVNSPACGSCLEECIAMGRDGNAHLIYW